MNFVLPNFLEAVYIMILYDGLIQTETCKFSLNRCYYLCSDRLPFTC
jgi:hypothetical protein